VPMIEVPTPDLQIEFYKRLLQLKDHFLLDALLKTVGQLDTALIDKDLAAFASVASLRKLASWGLRGELLFPVPTVLTANPHLLGYYRLLLGFSQKEFYTVASGISKFKAMEERGSLGKAQAAGLQGLCRALCSSAHVLVQGVGTLSASSIHDLTLLTLGPQLRGGKLNVLGSKATRKVFDLIKSSLKPAITTVSAQELEVPTRPAGWSSLNSRRTLTSPSGNSYHPGTSGTSSQLKSREAATSPMSTTGSVRPRRATKKPARKVLPNVGRLSASPG